MLRITPRLFTAQPQIPVGINWANPITRGLIGAFCPSMGLVNIANPTMKLTPHVATPLDSNAQGRVWVQKTGNAGLFMNVNGTAFTTSTDGYTLLWQGTLLGAKVGPYDVPLIGVNYASTNVAPYVSYVLDLFPTAGNVCGNVGGFSGSPKYVAAYGQTFSLSCSFAPVPSGGEMRNFANGAFYMSASSTNLQFSATSQLAIAGFPDRTRSPNVATALGLVFNRILNDAEQASLGKNPWQVFRPLLC